MKSSAGFAVLVLVSIFLAAANLAVSQKIDKVKVNSVSLQINGAKRFQQIDGFGVNANTAAWNGNELQPAINMLLDSMNATIWRVIVETVYNWEEKNDNADPFTFNWEYYNKLYETPKYHKAWDMIRYLNSRGITDKLMINFMGPLPTWMGGKYLKEKYEDEYIEMIVSFFYYAINTKHLQIGLISIMNEPDIENEGPTVSAEKYPVLFKKFYRRMDSLGLGYIKYVAPDVAGMDNGIYKYLPGLMKDPEGMSKMAHIGLHSYAGYYANVDSALRNSSYPNKDYWLTEWNEWCNGCDDGILGEYNYSFGARCVNHLLSFLKHGATAGIVWEGYDSYYEHHAPSPFSYWGMLSYDPVNNTYMPRKNFYAILQVSKFVLPGSWRIDVSGALSDSLVLLAFHDEKTKSVRIVGINKAHTAAKLKCQLSDLPAVSKLGLYYTDQTANVKWLNDVPVKNRVFNTVIPADCIFTLSGNENINAKNTARPEPSNWYAGDIHVHKNCGDDRVMDDGKLQQMMEPNNLAVISVLADMGNGEVKYADKDLLKVNGKDAAESKPGRIIHWDTEWHWDATYSNFSNQALGGHLVLLGLQHAKQIWEESPYKILDWGKEQNAVKGFAHFQYLNNSIQDELNCCIPIDYPVEAALGTIDFVSEDVYGNSSPDNGTYNSEAVINAYYRLLNCGFKLALAAGTDFPCNADEPLGTLLTYVKVDDQLTYGKWIDGIKKGNTVVSRNGHNEFLELTINDTAQPGDEIKLDENGSASIRVKWSAIKQLSGSIELVSNGKVIAALQGTVKPGDPIVFNTTATFAKSSWVCARHMDKDGHETHSSPVYISINNQPIRASAADAKFFIAWIDNILKNIEPGAKWHKYFPNDYTAIKARYLKAKNIYQNILKECTE